MAYTQSFGTGGTSSNGTSNTASTQIYMPVAGQTGNYALDGSRPVVYNSVSVNGPYSNVGSITYDGSNVYMNKAGAGTMYFSRYIGDGQTIYDPQSPPNFTNGGFHGSYTWTTVAGVPSSCSASRSGRSVTVTATAATDAGGGTISSYKVQYRTSADGSTGWSAWGSEQTLSSLSYTYTSLTPALYYQFRVYAVNEVGNSAATASSNVFVSGGGKRWTGSSWDSTTIAKRFDGTNWVDLTIAKRWDGSTWTDLG